MANTTWNPADRVNTTLSGGNLVAAADFAGGGVRSAHSLSAGKYYWENTYTVLSSNALTLGIALATASLTAPTTACAKIQRTTGNILVNNINTGSSISGGSAIAAGSVIGMAVDFTAQLIWFRLGAAGQWNGSGTANPATGVGGLSITPIAGALFAFMNGQQDTVTANFGDTAFSGTVPAGFTAGFPAGAVGPAPPAKDQSGTNTSTGGTTTTISVTSAANSVVVVGACVGSTSTTTIPTLSIAGAGLTWNAAPPGSGIGNVNFRMAVRCFWAYTASALTAQTVTITSSLAIDAAATGYETLTGANAASPVDPNALSTFGSFGAGTTGTITTTNANDTCIVVIGSNYNTGPAVPVGTGTRDLSIVGSNGLFAYFALGRWSYTTVQTGATVGFTGVGAAGGLSAITLTADAAAVTGSQARVLVMA